MTTLALSADYWNSVGHDVGAIVLYAIIGLALMLVGFFAVDITTPGQLREMVREGKPNAVAVAAASLLSIAFIVVLAIFSSSGKLSEGLIATSIYGVVGIIALVMSVRILERFFGIDIGACLSADSFTPHTLAVAGAQIGLGLVVAVAIL